MVPLCCTEFKKWENFRKNLCASIFVFQFNYHPSTTKKMYPEIFGIIMYIPFEFLTVKKYLRGKEDN